MVSVLPEYREVPAVNVLMLNTAGEAVKVAGAIIRPVVWHSTWCHKHKWMGHVLRHDGLLHGVLEEQEVEEGYS